MSPAPGSTCLCHVCSQATHLQKYRAGLGRVRGKLSFLMHFGEGKWSWRAQRGAAREGSRSRAPCDCSAWPRNPIPGREAAQQQELCPVKAAFLLNEVPKPPLCPKHEDLLPMRHQSIGSAAPQLTASLGYSPSRGVDPRSPRHSRGHGAPSRF